jgi:hypothetical protein
MDTISRIKGHESFIAHLEATISFFEQEHARITTPMGSFLIKFGSDKLAEAFTRAISVVTRIAGRASHYMEEIRSIRESKFNPDVQFEMIMGILKGLRFDLQQGYLQTLRELVHADLFSDYLDMASYLQEEGYKVAAAVIAGSTLEEHQRKLADKYGIDITLRDKKGKEMPKKAHRLNEDLTKAGVYSANGHKSVTALLALRTSAAHGRDNEYTLDQVGPMILAIRELVNRLPA